MPSDISSFPVLQTNRLLLRQLTMNDENEIFELRSDDIVNKHLNRAKAKSIQDAKDFITKINTGISNSQSMFWAICFKEEEKLIGTICLWNFSEQGDRAEIGYELLPQFHGKGIMQEAILKVIEFGFNTLALKKIEAWTVTQNDGSLKILERNHFERDHELESAIDRNTEGPHLVIYSLSKEGYLNSRL